MATVKEEEAEVRVEEVMEEEEGVMAVAQAAMVAEEEVVEVHLAAATEASEEEEVMEEEEEVTGEEVEEVTEEEEGAAGVHLAGAMEAEETAMAQETMATPHRGKLKETEEGTLLTPVGPHTDPEMTSPVAAAALEGSRMTTMMTTRAINSIACHLTDAGSICTLHNPIINRRRSFPI